MSSDTNKAVIERWWTALNTGDTTGLVDATYADTYVMHDPSSPGPVRGRQGVSDFIATIERAFPNGRYTLHDVLADGDKVAQRVQFVATHRDEFFGIPATGKPVDLQVYVISRFEDGKVVEEW